MLMQTGEVLPFDQVMAASIVMKRHGEAAVYRKEYANPEYKMGAQRLEDVERLLRLVPRGSLLDVGTGRGEALQIAGRLGFSLPTGTETVPELLTDMVSMAYAHDLLVPDGSFDVVTCFDVLEHLIEEDLIPAVKEFARVARSHIILSASEIPSSQWGGGRDLHISKRPAAEWEKLFREAAPGWTITRQGTAGGSPAWILTK